jgi:hypothetical protein
MKKFKIPEILFGALLTVAVLGAASPFVLGDFSFKEDRNSTKGLESNLTGTTWLTKDASGTFTALAAGIAALQAGLFFYQLRLMNRSLEDTRRAAVAAESAADVAQHSVDLAKHTAERQLRAYVLFENGSIFDFAPNVPFKLSVRIKNYGQTPALEARNWVAVSFDDFPIPRSSIEKLPEEHDRHRSSFDLGAGASVTLDHIMPAPTQMACDEMKLGKRAIYIFGEITYLDVFGHERKTKFKKWYGGVSDRNPNGALTSASDGNSST